MRKGLLEIFENFFKKSRTYVRLFFEKFSKKVGFSPENPTFPQKVHNKRQKTTKKPIPHSKTMHKLIRPLRRRVWRESTKSDIFKTPKTRRRRGLMTIFSNLRERDGSTKPDAVGA